MKKNSKILGSAALILIISYITPASEKCAINNPGFHKNYSWD
jgi:hypothetical protein